MATPQEKLAQSLEVLKRLQNNLGIAIIKAEAISRVHKERLLKNGFIKEVMKGWYISCNPEERAGDTTSWYASYWQFCEIYLNDKFGEEWCVSPEQSISIHSENWTIPSQLIIRSTKANNQKTDLLYNTSLYMMNLSMPIQAANIQLTTLLNASRRRVLGEVTFIQVVRDEREALMKRIRDQLDKEAGGYGIEVVDVRIRRADLPEQNSQAVYQRMQTERQREAAEFRAQGGQKAQEIRSNADREATVIIAEANSTAEQTRGAGDAERNRLFAEAYSKDPDFFAFYRSMTAYENGLKRSDERFL